MIKRKTWRGCLVANEEKGLNPVVSGHLNPNPDELLYYYHLPIIIGK